MSLRAELKALEKARMDSESFYLVLLEDEESVSIHPQKELLRPDAESCSVGTTCVVPFGKHQYEGKIISSGSKLAMITAEKDYIRGLLVQDAGSGSKEVEKEKGNCNKSTLDGSFKEINVHEEKGETISKQVKKGNGCKEFEKSLQKHTLKKAMKENDNNKRDNGNKPQRKRRLIKESSTNPLPPDVAKKPKQNTNPKETREKKEDKAKGKKDKVKGKKEKAKEDKKKDSYEPPTSDDNCCSSNVKPSHPREKVLSCNDGSKPGHNRSNNSGELMRLVNEILNEKNEIKSLVDRVQNLESLIIPQFQAFNGMMNASPIPHNYRLPYGYTPISSRAPVDKLPTPDFPGEKPTTVSLNKEVPSTSTPLNQKDPGSRRLPSSSIQSSSSDQISPEGNTPEVTTPECKVSFITKSNTPLPSIDKSKLISPDEVVAGHPKLLKLSKIPTLSVKLARDSYFGKEVMVCCTVRGLSGFHALPVQPLKDLKRYLLQICVPSLTTTLEFEAVWKNCIEGIGQACKALRASKP